MRGISFPYNANKNLGLIAVLLMPFYGPNRTDGGEIILNDRSLIIPPSLLYKTAQIIPYKDVFQVQSLYLNRMHVIVVRHDGGQARITKRGLRFGDYDKLLAALQNRVKAAGGGGLGLS